MTVFSDAFLSGTSTSSRQPSELLRDGFDVMILVSSWDSRSIAVTAADGLTADESILVLFDVRDQQGLRDKHDVELGAFAARQSQTMTVLKGSSTDLAGLWPRLLNLVLQTRQRLRRPLRLFLDLSACPRYYALALLANTLGTGVVSSCSLFYAEGTYDEAEGVEERHEIFTSGRWSSVPVPGLVGAWSPGKSRFYLASVGFEAAKTLRAVSRGDPDRVAVLLPDPGVRPDYAERTRVLNAELFEQFQVPNERVIRAPAGDAIRAWREISLAPDIERPDHENSFYVCSGTKPHSVALALRAMAVKHPTVLYNLPDAHRVTGVQPSGVFWSYRIEDLSALPL